jgi:two-component system cell cycle response regulator
MDAKGATLFLGDPVSPSCLDSAETTTAAGAMYLILQNGAIPGAMLRLAAGDNTLGRMEDNTHQIAEGTISRHHALLRIGADGCASLTDLGTTNGTFRNGRPLEPHRAAALKEGDRIRFGSNIVARFSRPDHDEERFQREMFERTVRDPLTGLHNRAYFLDLMETIGRRSAADGLGLAVLMLDVDHFKDVNDLHGHDMGDAVLREVARILKLSTRVDDLVARYGGEEFVAALPIAEPAAAIDRAERTLRNLAAKSIALGGASISVTASIGLAFASPDAPRPAAALLSAADRGLYQAKRSGRNRVVYVSDTLPTHAHFSTTIDDDLVF